MKKFLVVIVALVFCLMLSGIAFAGQARQNTGCGLGTVLWKDKGDNSAVSQAFQATTNGTFGFQTFGITTGTMECQKTEFVQDRRLNQFVAGNMDGIAKDIAMGRGESLDTLAELMQVPVWQRPGFYAHLQQNFSKIFTSEKIESGEVIDNIVIVSIN